MNLEHALAEAKKQADSIGYQIVVVEDAIANAEDESGPFGYMPTLSIPVFISSLKHGGRIVEVVEPSKSKKDRRKDLEDGLVDLFRRDPNAIAR